MATRIDIPSLFARFNGLRVLVIGDLMLDRYLWGRVSRISPEAPVPIVDVQKEENRPGGAANVAANLVALGCHPVLCGSIGNDYDGVQLTECLGQLGLETSGLVQLPRRRTTTKIRVIGGSQQMLRVDKEDASVLHSEEQALVRSKLMALLETKWDAIIFEDYDKGLLHEAVNQEVIAQAAKRNVPVLVDPKFRNFYSYGGSTVFKPNMKELNEALGRQLARNDFEGIQQAVLKLRERMPHSISLVTLSEQGVLLCDAHLHFRHIPAHYRQIVDVSGAGDTVISVMAAAIASGVAPADAAALANLAGGLVCERVGVVPIDKLTLQQEASAFFA